jgi:hypothetical protein
MLKQSLRLLKLQLRLATKTKLQAEANVKALAEMQSKEIEEVTTLVPSEKAQLESL